jgi:hypothetical protein
VTASILAALAGFEARVVATMEPLEAKVDGLAKAVAERASSGNSERTMIYVYRSARGIHATVEGADVWEAWGKANKRRRVEVLWEDTGAGWAASLSGGAVREKDHDRTPEEIAALVSEFG